VVLGKLAWDCEVEAVRDAAALVVPVAVVGVAGVEDTVATDVEAVATAAMDR
jgi:hypothetical protein